MKFEENSDGNTLSDGLSGIVSGNTYLQLIFYKNFKYPSVYIKHTFTTVDSGSLLPRGKRDVTPTGVPLSGALDGNGWWTKDGNIDDRRGG